MIKEITRQELNPLLDALVRNKISAVEFGDQHAQAARKLLKIVMVKSNAGSRFAIKLLRNGVESSSGIYLSDCDKDDLVEKLNDLIQNYPDTTLCRFYQSAVE